jgi:hypothetical protein
MGRGPRSTAINLILRRPGTWSRFQRLSIARDLTWTTRESRSRHVTHRIARDRGFDSRLFAAVMTVKRIIVISGFCIIAPGAALAGDYATVSVSVAAALAQAVGI